MNQSSSNNPNSLSGAEELLSLLSSYDFDEAKKLYNQKYYGIVNKDWFYNNLVEYRRLAIKNEENEARNAIKELLRVYDFNGAMDLYEKKYTNIITYEEFKKLRHPYKVAKDKIDQEIQLSTQKTILSLLKKDCFNEAEDLATSRCPVLIKNGWLAKQKTTIAENKLSGLFRKYYFDKATEKYQNNYLNIVSREWFDDQLNTYKKQKADKEWEEKRRLVDGALANYNFLEADQKAGDLTYSKKYLETKALYVAKWFRECVRYKNGEKEELYTLDNEQALAIAETRNNVLVAARAGSGKTRTLVAKIILLIAKYNYFYKDLLVFVFNTDARSEINERLKNITVNGVQIVDDDMANTFHSFAYKLIYNTPEDKDIFGEILYDRGHAQNRTAFIQELLKDFPKEKIYEFFRNESLRNQSGDNNRYEIYDVLRDEQYDTLDGKIVRSRSEKIICDYLFEHGIKYHYENEIFTNGLEKVCSSENDKKRLKKYNSIKPDFYLPDYKLYWEHWMFNGQEDTKALDANILPIYDKYVTERNWKQWFYGKEWLDEKKKYLIDQRKSVFDFIDSNGLIETYRPQGVDRKKFEAFIYKILHYKGIHKDYLSKSERIDLVWEKQIKRFTKMVESFIDRAEQKYYMDFNRLKADIDELDCDERTKSFLNISFDCYRKYIYFLRRDAFGKSPLENERSGLAEFSRYGMDFNMLLKRAIEAIKRNTDSAIKDIISTKKYIIIDEYQDFSELFYELIRTIIDVTSEVNNVGLFAVGDDWQAINRFAGSDVSFFTSFRKYFPIDSTKHEISANYRSSNKVVSESLKVIQNSLNEYSDISAKSNVNGSVFILDPSKTFIDYVGNEDWIYRDASSNIKTVHQKKIIEQNLKECTESVIGNYIKDTHITKSILLLHRNNKFSFFLEIQQFLELLKEVVCRKYGVSKDEANEKISMLTMHKAKGLESDVVIILEADKGVIPAIHQNTCLYEIFGESIQVSLDDQARLFYVAMTRAKEDLYILHINENEFEQNGFVRYINPSKRG